MELEKALQIVKAAGYRVSKPKPKEKPEKGPTCVTTFTDGQVVRMSVATFDRARAGRIASCAWQSRMMRPLGAHLAVLNKQRQELDELEKPTLAAKRAQRDYPLYLEEWSNRQAWRTAPPIEAMHFERDGVRLDV